MTWAKLVAGLFSFLNALADYFARRDAKDLGRLQEKERRHEENIEIAGRIDDGVDNANSLPDDEVIRRG